MIQHVALEVRRADVPACERFFALLGFARVAEPPGLTGSAVWLQSGATQVHLLLAEEPVAPPQGHVAVVARDYDAALAGLRAAGYDPQSRREHWGAARCFVRGPGGHRVEVMAAPPG